ncbi:cation:proton antiporter [Tabrizicola sp. J26]|uniref:cation:proton antiporter domain-containing protein n=1 Tax=Alitabrizicola rongguiensis TaxID=2909234 RepID=UPI001F317D8C|nr:cation:proton antiporter [Tabrizicola rongguiensis]MCF1707767.1 cation:proton antiporter [Tabrizicola rongguiensis]
MITTIAVGLALACILGVVAHRLRLPLIAGYLAAGVVIGPFTPGYVADQEIASQLAEMGVILLMFGVGLHFSLKDLLSVRRIAIPGAIGQIAVATAFGAALGIALGWGVGAGLIFGLSLSVASTVVLLRALQDRALVAEEQGRIAVGWLIVEDLVMVVALVMIPPLAGLLGGQSQPVDANTAEVARLGFGTVGATLLLTAIKVTAFVAVMLIGGARVVPWLLHYTAHTGQRELFRLSVLSIALGVAFAASAIFGVSFALGAFFAGMVMSRSTLSAQAMKDTLPFRDAFAVLFFVSVGMLFNPNVLVEQPVALAVTILVIIAVKSVAAYGIVRAFGYDKEVGLTIAASLAQIGEFSFILIVMAEGLDIVPPEARDLIVAGALASILFNPLMFAVLDRRRTRKQAATAKPETAEA